MSDLPLISPILNDIPTDEIAQYSAKSFKLLGAKIAQFPKGSRFIMTNGIPESEEQKKMDGSVKGLLEQHGMVVERNPH